MSSRIKEMWEESTNCGWPAPGKFTAGEYDHQLENFAELIIYHAAECVRTVLRDSSSTLNYEDAATIQQNIKAFFGVSK